jgi:ABC-type nitrate/sulfonate/bicarbonate transport system substrate-binding protein
LTVKFAKWMHAALLVAAALTAPARPVAAEDLTPVTLMLNWTPNNHHAGIYLALANGWYEAAGLALEIVEPAAAGAEQVVGAGRADFGISQAESVIPARANGVPVVSIATILPFNDSSLMSLTADGITRPRDLAGKTYGGYGGSLEHELITRLVACDGGDPASVKFVEVGNIDYLAALEQDLFDFVWVFEGWDALRARAVAGKDISTLKFVDYLDCIPDWYTPVFIASEATIAERPELVERFLSATARGYRQAIAHPEEAAAALLAAVPELDKDLVEAAARYHAPLYATAGQPWGLQDAATWRQFEGFLRESGLITTDVDPEAAFTNAFLAAEPVRDSQK